METIQIRMLGSFSLRLGDQEVSDASNRSRKVWCLLAYLLCSRGRMVGQQKLIDLLWGGTDTANPENALRITLHRLRTMLDGLWPGAGRELIVYREGGYGWNPDQSVELDYESFEELSQPVQDEEQRLECRLKALALYQGEFLPKLSSELWIIPVAAHFQNLFLEMTLEAAALLQQRGRYTEAAAVCRRAAEREPYHEPVHQQLMLALGAAGDRKGAGAVYEALSKRLFDDFGIRPNEQTRNVYRTVAHTPEERTLLMDEILEQLQEPTGKSGAMICDYDYFKVLCYAESRSMERSGHATHVALLNMISPDGNSLNKRSLDRAMEQFGEQLRLNLRRGDTISRCSASQYIIMLPKANYENSSMVCRRLLSAFFRAHPRAAVKINYMVQPLSPSICIP